MTPIAPLKADLKPLPAENLPYRVMLVDDSVVARGFISKILEGEAELKIVSSVGDGQAALLALERMPADVVVLDIEMPLMDGLTALPRLKAIDPSVQIVMASTLTQKNAALSLKAMNLGAADYLPKPSSQDLLHGAQNFKEELLAKIKMLGAVARKKGVRGSTNKTQLLQPPRPIALRPQPIQRPAVIAIGSSTGGPQALLEVVRGLGSRLPQPILIAQHMPPAFTAMLAQHIARQCAVVCSEAQADELFLPGRYYVAPGDFHLRAVKTPRGVAAQLSQDPPVNFCRPAVDPLLNSLAEAYGGRTLAVILTGMGQDGWKGSLAVTGAGGAVLAQNEATSVVWGMPGAVAMAGLCSAVLPLDDMAAAIRKIAGAL